MTEQQRKFFEALYADRLDSSRTFEKRSMRGVWTSVVEKYSDQAHFVYELLQNADDVGATSVHFDVQPDKLLFSHNGTRHFSVTDPEHEDEDSENGRLGDINAITSIANSNKKDKSTIGKFGVGFKAVFQYTATPAIYDPGIAFRIVRFIVPELISEDYLGRKKDDTLFVFPFNLPERPAEVAVADITNKLKSLVFPQLFLQHLANITFTANGLSGQYIKKIQETIEFGETIAENILLERIIGKKTEKEFLWLFSRTDTKGNRYSVGFFHDEKGKLKPKDLAAFCFFPTKAATNLHFIIHAPFLLTDSREGIQAAVPHNKEMVRLLSELSADSLLFMRDISMRRTVRLIDSNLFDIIPYDESDFADEDDRDSLSFMPIYLAIENCIRNERILPGKYGYVHSHNAYWANTPQTSEIFGDDKLQTLLCDDDAHWIYIGSGSASCYNSNYYLYRYLSSTIDVSIKNDSDLIRAINGEYIEGQQINWLLSFYKYITVSKERVDLIKYIPIFLDESGNACAPYTNDNGKQAVLFIPAEGIEGFRAIQKELYEYEETKELAKALDMQEPTLKDEIYNIILPQYNEKNVENTEAHFRKLYQYYLNCPQADLSDYIHLISKYDIVLCRHSNSPKQYRSKADNAYWPSKELKFFLAGKKDTLFVDLKYYDGIELPNSEKLQDFFAAIGVRMTPAIRKIELRAYQWYNGELITTDDITKQYAPGTKWSSSSSTPSWTIPVLDGAEEALKQITEDSSIDLSIFVWNLLLSLCQRHNILPNYSFSKLESLFTGTYHYFYYRNRTQSFRTKIITSFQETAWLFDRQGNRIKPNQINIHDLSEKYDCTNEYAPKVIEFLGIKLDLDAPDSALSEDQKAKIKVADTARELGYSDEQAIEILRREKQKEIQANATINKSTLRSSTNDSIEGQEEDTDQIHLDDDPDLEFGFDLDEIDGINEEGTDSTEPVHAGKAIRNVMRDIRKISQGRYDSATQEQGRESTKENSPDDLERFLTIDPFDEDDEDEYTHPSIDYKKQIEREKQKSASEIGRIALTEQNEEAARKSKKYSYKWFKALLNLEIINSDQDSANKRSFSISFARVQREEGTSRTLVLEHPDRYIPQSMEDLADISLVLRGEDFEKSVAIEVVNVRSYTLRAKLKNADQIKGIDLAAVKQASISVQNPVFLLDELKKEFVALELDDDYNLQDNLCENIRFIFGPPGTGKTTHLATNVILPLMHQEENARILVLTPTNKAADVLTSRVIEKSPNTDYLDWLIRFGATADEMLETIGVYKDKSTDIKSLKKCTVVTTIARFPYDFFIPGDGSRVFLNGMNWDYIIIDEASMIPLINIIYPLYKKTPKEFIIAGDPFQIQPITSVDQWKDENIYTLVGLRSFRSNSITKPHAYQVERLMTQYRSIPSVGTVFSNFAYDGALRHHRLEASRKPLNLGNNIDLASLNIVKFPVSKYESIYRPKRLNKSNYQVYSALFSFEFSKYLADLLAKNNPGGHFSIGIIAPYRAESDLIEKLVATVNLPKEITIQVGTIHGFQGDECDIIITVFNTPPRITDSPNMFLNKRNIINVAISRARDYLFVIMPDNNTDGINNLTLVKRIEALCRLNNSDCHVFQSPDLERLMFGRSDYLEINSFATSHQSVNVYGLPERKYEIRSEESAVDIQVHEIVASKEVGIPVKSDMTNSETSQLQQTTIHTQKVDSTPDIQYTEYYQLTQKTKSCPFDHSALVSKPLEVDCFDGNKRKINFQVCSKCGKKYIFNLGNCVDLSKYAVRAHDLPQQMTTQPSSVETKEGGIDQHALKTSPIKQRVVTPTATIRKPTLAPVVRVRHSDLGIGEVTDRKVSNGKWIITVRFATCVKSYQEDLAYRSGTLTRITTNGSR